MVTLDLVQKTAKIIATTVFTQGQAFGLAVETLVKLPTCYTQKTWVCAQSWVLIEVSKEDPRRQWG